MIMVPPGPSNRFHAICVRPEYYLVIGAIGVIRVLDAQDVVDKCGVLLMM